MKDFKLNNDIFYTIDVNGISLVNIANNTHTFIQYPEAAAWSVLIGNYKMSKSVLMLKSILGKTEPDTVSYIRNCLNDWKQLNIIQ